ncbi:Rhodanese-like domain-containing protein [Papiliotrema laurentii]|uniref:protein-tyrosine-phosphatase n=1 Tax=Papiliotrema laurentii TaxID=5418 RepID=A0AAD9FRX0_PAPLA|nr:Rhodanese-like domain-containing protein [Papiliotrema laurentii]
MSFSLPYKWITAEELAALIKSKSDDEMKRYAVVDVRDSDFAGGNIIRAINSPSETFYDSAGSLVKQLEDVPQVIFHCALSQQRGPKAARASIYAETRREILPSAPDQEILVLRDGFTGFQQKYRDDPELVEKFNKFFHD